MTCLCKTNGEKVREFMEGCENQPVRTGPTTDISKEERVLRARLVLEEALEFVLAMGCVPVDEDGRAWSYVETHIDPSREINLPEAADALADSTYVIEGSAHTLGVPLGDVFAEVHRANMQKLTGPKRADGKQLKPEGWQPPDVEGVLREAGWVG